MDLLWHLHRQAAWSERTFGPGPRTHGVIDHIRKELEEVEADPLDLEEWVDVALLALDGAWRTGATPYQIVVAIEAKQSKNEARQWPDWRTAPADKAIEHYDKAAVERIGKGIAMSREEMQRLAVEGREIIGRFTANAISTSLLIDDLPDEVRGPVVEAWSEHQRLLQEVMGNFKQVQDLTGQEIVELTALVARLTNSEGNEDRG